MYGTRELYVSQKEFLLSKVRSLDPKPQEWSSVCLFEPHHTMRFYAADKLTSTMEICFKRSQVEWTATKANPPGSLYSGLAQFIESIGLSPDRDWSALAKEHLARVH